MIWEDLNMPIPGAVITAGKEIAVPFLCAYAAEKGLDIGIGTTWKTLRNKLDTKSPAGELYNLIEALVNSQIRYKENVPKDYRKKSIDFDILAPVCEIICDSVEKNGKISQDAYIKTKSFLDGHKMCIASIEVLNDDLTSRILKNEVLRNNLWNEYLINVVNEQHDENRQLDLIGRGVKNIQEELAESKKDIKEFCQYAKDSIEAQKSDGRNVLDEIKALLAKESSESDSSQNQTGYEFNYNCIKEYAGKWEEELFLHKGKGLRLCDLYLPLYGSINSGRPNNVESIVNDFLVEEEKNALILLGNPGLGKSSLYSKYAYFLQNEKKVVFIRFLDLETSIAQKSLLDAITDCLGCKTRDLQNTILFIDGYDELRVDGMHYRLCLDFISLLRQKKIKAVISSRQNYINLNKKEFERDYTNAMVVDLAPFSNDQIINYIKQFGAKTQTPVHNQLKQLRKVTTDREILGIPFILYLICSLRINIASIENMASVYNQIFAMEGGLFDKIYDPESEHYLTNNTLKKRALLSISEEIAYEMFKNYWRPLSIEFVEQEILDKKPEYKKTFAIGNYYVLEDKRISFVHKTFAEYFMCRRIISFLTEVIDDLQKKRMDPKDAADRIFKFFFCNSLIYKRLNTILAAAYKELSFSTGERDILRELFPALYDEYLSNIYADPVPSNGIIKSQNYLSSIHNLGNILQFPSFEGLDQFKISLILKSKQYVRLHLNNCSIKDNDISGAYMRGIYNLCVFSDCNLSRCDFSKSRIYSGVFNNCKMYMTYLEYSRFRNTRFEKTTIFNSDFKDARLMSVRFDDDCSLKSVVIRSATIESCQFNNTKFEDCEFIDVKFIDCSIEASEIDNTYFKNCSFVNTKISRCIIYGKDMIQDSQAGEPDISNCNYHDRKMVVIDITGRQNC